MAELLTYRSPATIEPWESRAPAACEKGKCPIEAPKNSSPLGGALARLHCLAEDSEKLATFAEQKLRGVMLPTVARADQVEANTGMPASMLGREIYDAVGRVEAHLRKIYDSLSCCDL